MDAFWSYETTEIMVTVWESFDMDFTCTCSALDGCIIELGGKVT